MTDNDKEEPAGRVQSAHVGNTSPPVDLTGRQGIVRSVVASWTGHLVFVVVGFVLPHMLDRRIGQEALGVWDFGWSLTAYFGLVSGGVMGAVNRYVAHYRMSGDTAGLCGTVSTGLAIYSCTGTVVLALTLGATALVPVLFTERMGPYLAEAQWVVLLLGLSMTVQFVFAVFNGVLTGCHKWGTHNAITAGMYAATATGMIVALLAGGQLRAIAAVTLAGEVASGLLRRWAAYRYCPELRLSMRSIHRAHAREMIIFGGKTMLGSVSDIIKYQTSSLLIMHFLGPATLALYSRPAALVRHTRMLASKLAHVLSPSASAFEASRNRAGLEELLIKGTRYTLYLAMPALTFLAILGTDVLRIWMGDHYVYPWLITILAIGHLVPFSQQATYQVLMGMGRHGLPSVARLAAACCTAVLAFVAMGPLQWGVIGAALAIVVPLTLIDATATSLCACRALKLSYLRYLVKSARGPALSTVLFSVCLLVAKYGFRHRPLAAVLVGMGLGGGVLAVIYYRYVLPPSFRDYIRRIKNAMLKRPATGRA